MSDYQEFPKCVYTDTKKEGTSKVFRSDVYCKSVNNEDEQKAALTDGFRLTFAKAVKKPSKKTTQKAD
jgi:hypothetical protein